MPDRPVADIRLGNLVHGNRGLHAHIAVELLERIRERERIDGGGQHSHMISTGAVHIAA